MSPERQTGDNQEILITLPSELRIRQRLGQLSIGEELIPRITHLERSTMPVRGLVLALDFELRDLAEDKAFGVEQLTIHHLPRAIELLVDDENKRYHALGIWEEMVNEKREDAEKIERTKARKLPRKQKKKARSSQMDLSKAHAKRTKT